MAQGKIPSSYFIKLTGKYETLSIPSIDASRSGGHIPTGGNGFHKEDEIEHDISEVTAALGGAGDDEYMPPMPKKSGSMKAQYEQMLLENERIKNELRELSELVKMSNPVTSEEDPQKHPDPYPGWDPSAPDFNFPYTGVLYREDSKKVQTPIDEIHEMDFYHIALNYGRGKYKLRLFDNQGPTQPINITSEFLRSAIKLYKEDYLDILNEQAEIERLEKKKMAMLGDEPPTQSQKTTLDPMIELLKDQNNRSLNMLEKVSGSNPGGATFSDVQKARTDGYNEGVKSRDGLIENLKLRIEDLKEERDELKETVEKLRIELGQMPDPNETEEEDDDTSEKQVNPLDRWLELGNKLLDYAGKNKSEIPQKLIEEKEKVQKIIVMNSDNFKKVIFDLFAKQKPVAEAAVIVRDTINLFGMVEKKFINSTIANNPAEAVVDMMVQYFMPEATPEIKNYVKQIVNHIKQPKG